MLKLLKALKADFKIQFVPKKRTTFFQMTVTHFRIVEITKVGGVLERAGADPQTNIIIFLSLNWEPRYLSLKLTQCQKILDKKYRKQE